MTLRQVVLVVAFASAAIVGVIVLRDREEGTSVVAPTAVRTHEPSSPPPPSDAGPAGPPPASGEPHRPAVSSALQREYLASTDWYAFAKQALRRPAEGGRWYAADALFRCEMLLPTSEVDAQVRKTIVANATLSARQRETLDRIRQRCSGFGPLAVQEISQLLKTFGPSRDDPLMDVARALSDARGPETRIPALRAMLQMDDPLLLSSMAPALRNADHVDGARATGPWFDGHDFREASASNDFDVALRYAVCEPGRPCNQDWFDDLFCATNGLCDDATEHLDAQSIDPSKLKPQDLAILRLAFRMREAIARGDLDTFRAPSTRP